MSERDLPDELPVFPLPNAVLFPGTSLPLNVFEPRYRQMVEDVLRHGRWIAVTLLKPGYEADYDGAPDFHEIGGAGFLVRSNRLEDGRFEIVLEGRTRVRLEEIPSARLYRMARAIPCPEDVSWVTGSEGTQALCGLLELAVALRMVKDEEARRGLPNGAARRMAFLNQLAVSVMADPQDRQAMLAAELPQRSELVFSRLRFSRDLHLALARHPRPEDPGLN
ncbi:MAG TPA: LON peptidase substrate-binding domain-containing protein [Candidatus Eisenbacteria bacterium]|nr:LON peptidase substrate-binding domain-containing protein [Candidatus Eisenbacteria bacterium]